MPRPQELRRRGLRQLSRPGSTIALATSPSERPNRRLQLALALALLALTGAAYARALTFGFVWDDHHLILENALTRGERPALEIWRTHFFEGAEPGSGGFMYRPLAIALFRLEWRLAGAPWLFHLDNLLLHLLGVALVMLLARRLGASPRGALLGGAAVALTSIGTEVVGWISARPDLLLAVGILVAAIALAAPAELGRIARPLLLGLGLTVALLSKETALFASLPLLLWACLPAPGVSRGSRVACVLAVVVPLGLVLALRYQALGGLGLAEPATDQTLATRLSRLGLQVRLLAGFELSALPEVAASGAARVVLLLLGIALPLVGLAGAMLAWRCRARPASVLILVALAILLPVLTVRLPALRYGYAPLLLLGSLAGPALDLVGRRWRPHLVTVLWLLLVAAWLALGQARLPAWRSDDTLFATEAALNPTNPDALYFHADRLSSRGRPAEAVPLLREALRLRPGHRPSWLALARAHLLDGDPRAAEQVIRFSLTGTPRTHPQYTMLAYALAAQRRQAEALAAFEAALALEPRSLEALRGAQLSARSLGRDRLAAELEQRLLRVTGGPRR